MFGKLCIEGILETKQVRVPQEWQVQPKLPNLCYRSLINMKWRWLTKQYNITQNKTYK